MDVELLLNELSPVESKFAFGIAELTRTKRFPPSRQKERVRALVELFT